MRTSLKAILAAAAIAVVASPVMAQSESRAYAAPSASVANARGSVAQTTSPLGAVVGRNQIRLDDCVHVAFPQCDGDAAQSRVDRP
jgi:uncharacterized lipoprotein YbaY